MLKAGLTGGIACGKSFVLGEFQKLGVHTVDADKIAHSLIQPGQPSYDRIVELFGSGILAPDGAIDHKKLGRLVFSQKSARQELNSIVHPFVFEEEERLIAEFKTNRDRKLPIIMVDAALMIETDSYQKYDCILVVFCKPSMQLDRLMARNHFSEEEAQKRIDSQMPLSEKVKFADYVIENSGRPSETQAQINHIFDEMLSRDESQQNKT